ncbi:hypothetical protein ABW20_dc0108048 [Dactylellina cionopaga]|nr:hypothetical protein ABW20_dc0108048 [Dactylellina cionopaga]
MLVFMEASAKKKEGRSFEIFDTHRYKEILKVLKQEGTLYYKFNIVLGAVHKVGIGGGAAATGISVAAGATATAMVPTLAVVLASGVAGWLGMTTLGTVSVATTVPEACATAGIIAFPVALFGTAILAGTYTVKNMEWREKDDN